MTTDSDWQAGVLERLAEQEPEQRVQHLCDAAQEWHAVGADDRARELFEKAIGAQGHAVRDERAAYARFLGEVGDTARAHEVLETLWRSRDLDGSAYYDAGTVCGEQLGDPKAALRWYTSGIIRLAGPDANGSSNDVWIELLMGARRSVRAQLGEPADEWDELWDTSVRNVQEREQTRGASASPYRRPGHRHGERVPNVPGRNDPCSCGSGVKYKRCCAVG